MVMAMNSEYRGTASGTAAKKKTATKTVATPGTKVSQATIDKIKKMGMSAALKGASGASAEMQEGLRRMYGANRVKAAIGSAKPAGLTQKITPERGAGFKNTSPYAFSGTKNASKPTSSAPSAISGKKVSTSSTKKATPAKSSSASNGLPGVTRGTAAKSKSTTTSASVSDRRKAAAAAVKRAGGRSM
jgi:hypothetical protein